MDSMKKKTYIDDFSQGGYLQQQQKIIVASQHKQPSQQSPQKSLQKSVKRSSFASLRKNSMQNLNKKNHARNMNLA